MSEAEPDIMAGNPFSTRSIRPGRVPPLDGSGRSLGVAELRVGLERCGGSAALVGPHGSGKTTLLWHLADALEARGCRVERVRLHGGRSCIALMRAVVHGPRGGIVCIDSWERLGWPGALAARWFAAFGGLRLLVTAHRPGLLPTLWMCRTSTALLAAIVERLPQAGGLSSSERDVQVADAFRRSAGDIREALFTLYDRFEDRARDLRLAGPSRS